VACVFGFEVLAPTCGVQSMKKENQIYLFPEPDPLKQKVRAMCGALLALFVYIVVWIKFGPFNVATTIVIMSIAIAICSFGAIKYGDSFWHLVFRSLKIL
jgi:hypothetical protein